MSGIAAIATRTSDANAGVNTNARIAMSQVSGSDYRVWVLSDSGGVFSRRDRPLADGSGEWRSHPAGGPAATGVAIAATSYVDGASTTEIAAYVGTTGAIKLGTIVNDGAATWVTISAPAGKQLSGELALGTVFQAGVRKLVIAATTTTADLYRYVSTGGNTGTWTDATNGQVWVTNTQLAITTNPGATILSIFGSINPPTHRLGMVRYDGSWAFTNLGRPAGKSVCNGISAVQGPTSTLVAGTYRFQVVCTPANSSLAEVYIAEAANDSTTTFTWSTLAVPSGALPTLATSVRRVAPPSSIAFESYFATPSNKHLIKVPNAATSVVDLGVPPDIDSLHKGLVAVPYYGGSRAVYVGGANGQGRLYERRGFEAGNIPQYYRALGDMNASLPFTSSGTFAETKASTWHGTTALVMINRPGIGPTDWPTIRMSLTDGATFTPPQTVPTAAGGYSFDYMVDPTVGVTDQRKAMIVGLGEDMNQCIPSDPEVEANEDEAIVYRATVYATSTTDGTSFSTPFVINSVPGGTEVTPIDHPHGDLERRAGQADVMHAVWWVQSGPTQGIRYAAIADNASSATPVQLSSGPASPPRIIANDSGRVLAYRGDDGMVLVCELNAARTGCTAPGWHTLVDVMDPSAGEYAYKDLDVPIVSGSSVIRTRSPFSVSLAPSGSELFYCFQRSETPGDDYPGDADIEDELDVFCAVGSRQANGMWQVSSAPFPIAGVVDDDRDQFLPEVVVTQEGATFSAGEESAIVTWFDRGASSANREYQIKRAISFDGFLTATTPRTVNSGALSDPEYAPRHCKRHGIRFVGDYNAAEGDTLHVFQPWVAIPTPGVTGSRIDAYWSAAGQWRQ